MSHLPSLGLNQCLFIAVIAVLGTIFVSSVRGLLTGNKPKWALSLNGEEAKSISFLRPAPLLTEWEVQSLLNLTKRVRKGFHVCPQVRLADLVRVDAPSFRERLRASYGVQRKSIDFIIVCEETREAVLGIELDDKSHDRPDRQKRDRYVEAVFEKIAVPLLRVKPYTRIELPEWLERPEWLEKKQKADTRAGH